MISPRFFVATVLAALLAIFSPTAFGEVIKVSSDPWEPWVIGNPGEEAKGGTGVNIAREIARRLNKTFEIRIYPYERCLKQMQSGERDMLLMVKKTPERETYMAFSDVASTDPQLVYYNPEKIKSFEWNTWADFKPYRIGLVRGFDYGEFTKAAKTHPLQIEPVANDNQNIKKLFAGRLDLILVNRSTMLFFLDNNSDFRYELKHASKPVSNASFHIGLARKGKAISLLPEINRVLREMKSDGTLNRLNATIN